MTSMLGADASPLGVPDDVGHGAGRGVEIGIAPHGFGRIGEPSWADRDLRRGHEPAVVGVREGEASAIGRRERRMDRPAIGGRFNPGTKWY